MHSSSWFPDFPSTIPVLDEYISGTYILLLCSACSSWLLQFFFYISPLSYYPFLPPPNCWPKHSPHHAFSSSCNTQQAGTGYWPKGTQAPQTCDGTTEHATMENVSSIAFTITYVATANAPSELLANSLVPLCRIFCVF